MNAWVDSLHFSLVEGFVVKDNPRVASQTARHVADSPKSSWLGFSSAAVQSSISYFNGITTEERRARGDMGNIRDLKV